jgi:hypothetical protein
VHLDAKRWLQLVRPSHHRRSPKLEQEELRSNERFRETEIAKLQIDLRHVLPSAIWPGASVETIPDRGGGKGCGHDRLFFSPPRWHTKVHATVPGENTRDELCSIYGPSGKGEGDHLLQIGRIGA